GRFVPRQGGGGAACRVRRPRGEGKIEMATRVAAIPPSAPTRRVQTPPCALVVFGAGGDLSRRKLLPALYNLAVGGTLPDRFALLGVARRGLTNEAFREEMRAAVSEFSRRRLDPELWRRFAEGVDYVSGDFEDGGSFERVSTRREQLDPRFGSDG